MAEHAADLLESLQELAEARGFDILATLLDIARQEAETLQARSA